MYNLLCIFKYNVIHYTLCIISLSSLFLKSYNIKSYNIKIYIKVFQVFIAMLVNTSY